jgi:ankyrin repeat protein
MNAIHLLFNQSDEVNVILFEELMSKEGMEFDSKDYQGNTPFFKIFKNNVTHKNVILETLLQRGVDIDAESDQGVTSFLHIFKANDFERSKKLIEFGAKVDHMDKKGNFAMKYAVERRNLEQVKYLISIDADCKLKDLHNRNLLHIALNYASTSANADIKIEKLLIAQGVGLNDKDIRERTPLHYSFVKINHSNASDMIDPIKSVAAYCASKDVLIDEPDFWGKTPLHYAA